jgi:hypothetical protein
VLAPSLRALAGTEDHGAQARPRRVPGRVQLRPCPQRPPDEGAGAPGYRLRSPEDGDRQMSVTCRHFSGLGRLSSRR